VCSVTGFRLGSFERAQGAIRGHLAHELIQALFVMQFHLRKLYAEFLTV
jgi:hypothetical protein